MEATAGSRASVNVTFTGALPLSSGAPAATIAYLPPLTRIRAGGLLSCFDQGEAAVIQSGVLVAELRMATGSVLPLGRFASDDVIPALDALSTPAFSLCYRAEQLTHIAWLPRRFAAQGGREQAARTRDALLSAAMRQITCLACLPATYRLYVELLRCASVSGNAAFDLPTHSDLAARTCTTRETISREVSLLRRHGILSRGKLVRILNPGDLLRRIAQALQLENEVDVWESIGVKPLDYAPH